jgi:hypothetical protein
VVRLRVDVRDVKKSVAIHDIGLEWADYVRVITRKTPHNYGKLVTTIDLAIDYEITFEDIRCIKSLIEFVSEYEKFYYQ